MDILDDDVAASSFRNANNDPFARLSRPNDARPKPCIGLAPGCCPCADRSRPGQRRAGGPPKSGEEDETRFSLTSEAGLNDGLTFPFIMCAIAIAEASRTGEPWFLHWLGYDVVWRISVGIGVGALLGYALGWIVFRIPNRAKLFADGRRFCGTRHYRYCLWHRRVASWLRVSLCFRICFGTPRCGKEITTTTKSFMILPNSSSAY